MIARAWKGAGERQPRVPSLRAGSYRIVPDLLPRDSSFGNQSRFSRSLRGICGNGPSSSYEDAWTAGLDVARPPPTTRSFPGGIWGPIGR